MHVRLRLATVALLALAMIGTSGTASAQEAEENVSTFEFVHLNDNNQDPVNVFLDGSLLFEAVQYRERRPQPGAGDPIPLTGGAHEVRLEALDGTVLGSVSFTALPHPVYVAAYSGDRLDVFPSSTFTFLNCNEPARPVRVFINGDLVFADVQFGETRGPTPVQTGGLLTVSVVDAVDFEILAREEFEAQPYTDHTVIWQDDQLYFSP